MNLESSIRKPANTGEYIVHEMDPVFCRTERTVKLGSATVLAAGTVMALDADKNAVALNPAASNSTAVAVGVLFRRVTVDGQKELLSEHFTQLRPGSLVWPDGITDAKKTKALKELEAARVFF